MEAYQEKPSRAISTCFNGSASLSHDSSLRNTLYEIRGLAHLSGGNIAAFSEKSVDALDQPETARCEIRLRGCRLCSCDSMDRSIHRPARCIAAAKITRRMGNRKNDSQITGRETSRDWQINLLRRWRVISLTNRIIKRAWPMLTRHSM